jgi:hypothetical protein
MKRTVGHLRIASSWSRCAQTAVVMSLALAMCLLVLPASASAKVDKKHAKAYAGKILICTANETEHRGAYNASADELQRAADDMIKVLAMDHSDPGYQTYLDALTQQDEETAHSMLTVIDPENVRELGEMKALYPACKGWFSKSADKIVFHSATSQLVRGFALSNQAFLNLAHAFDALSLTDVPTARSFNMLATQEITLGGPDVQSAVSTLTGLER